MSRNLVDENRIHPAIRAHIAGYHHNVIAEVQAAVAANAVVVVGMDMNPFPRKARKLLDGLATPYAYLSYGSYLSQWHPRLALKMWTGWPTFPMIFVKGTLIGGAGDLRKLVDSGEFAALLAG